MRGPFLKSGQSPQDPLVTISTLQKSLRLHVSLQTLHLFCTAYFHVLPFFNTRFDAQWRTGVSLAHIYRAFFKWYLKLLLIPDTALIEQQEVFTELKCILIRCLEEFFLEAVF